MKLFIKLMVSVLVIGLLLPFTLLKGKDGNPLLSFTDLKLPDVSMPDITIPDIDLPDMPIFSDEVQTTNGELPSGGEVIYKWTDTAGNLQFSDSPPPEGVKFTVKDYDSDLNVIQALEISTDKSEPVLENESEKKVINAEGVSNPYSPEKIEKLFEDAKNVEKLLNQRFTNQEAELGQ